MKKSKKVVALMLAASLFGTSFMSNGLTVKAAESAQTGSSGSTLSLDEDDLKHGTGLSETDIQEISAKAEENEEAAEERICAAIEEQATGNLPAFVDNSTGNNGKYFPPIGDQGQIGSCLTWADKYYNKTYMFNRYFDRAADETNIFSPKWGYANVEWLKGCITIDRCPITDFTDPNGMCGHEFYADCEADYMQVEMGTTDANVYMNSGMTLEDKDIVVDGVNSSDIAVIKKSLADGSILELGTYAYWFNYSTIDGSLNAENKKFTGESIIVACANKSDADKGGHAMSIVGYDDNIGVDLNHNGKLEKGEMGAFKVANSWGAGWKNKGFVWMAYDSFNKVSKYSDIGTRAGESRVSIADYIVELKIEEDRMNKYINESEPDMYYKATFTATDKKLRLSSLFEKGIAEIHKNYILSVSGGGNGYKEGINYRGKTDGTCEVTMISETLHSWENIDYVYAWNTSPQYAAGLKELVYVDNIQKKAYKIKTDVTQINKGNTTERFTNKADTREEIPYISNMNVTFANGTISVNAAANDTAGSMKYALSFESEATNDSGSLAQNTTGKFTITPKASGYYRVKLTATDKNGKTNTKTKLIKVTVRNLTFKKLAWDISGTASDINVKRTVKATVNSSDGNTSDITYKYTQTYNGTETVLKDYSKNASYAWTPKKTGKYTINVYAKAPNAKEVKKSVTYTINKKPTATIKYASNDFSVGKEISATVTISGGSGTKKLTALSATGGNYSYTAQIKYFNINGNTVTWTPDMDGDYTLQATIQDAAGYTLVNLGTLSVTSKKVELYYNNSSWNNANVHYMIDNGSWTSVPGVKMEASDLNGYKWKYVINLGSQAGATVCFNNGENTWDSNNGSNYRVTEGKYGISNGKVTNLNDNHFRIDSFTVSATEVNQGDYITMTAVTSNGSGVQTKFDIYKQDGSIYKAGSYAYGQSVQQKMSDAGTYTIYASAKDTTTGEEIRSSAVQVTVKGSNKVTVYYSGYTQPYIHYQVGNGSWTDVPGVKMKSDKSISGYTHSYTIDLGSADKATVCFNDGNGNWDSNNGSNYSVKAGTYGVKNGKVTKIK